MGKGWDHEGVYWMIVSPEEFPSELYVIGASEPPVDVVEEAGSMRRSGPLWETGED